jgi:DNA-binding NtrC family response regulator
VEIKGYTRDFLERLESYEWPGNVRELENVVKKAMVVCQTNILSVDDCHLPGETGIDVPETGREQELARVARRMLRGGRESTRRRRIGSRSYHGSPGGCSGRDSQHPIVRSTRSSGRSRRH